MAEQTKIVSVAQVCEIRAGDRESGESHFGDFPKLTSRHRGHSSAFDTKYGICPFVHIFDLDHVSQLPAPYFCLSVNFFSQRREKSSDRLR